MDMYRRQKSVKIVGGKFVEKTLPENPCKIPVYLPTGDELSAQKEINKARKQALTRSQVDMNCADEYDRRDIYTSHTKRTHIPLQGSSERPGTAAKKLPWTPADSVDNPIEQPMNTEATWLRRSVDRYDVEEMPNSGSAEYPNYINASTPSPQQIQADLELSKARKKALTMSNIEVVFKEDDTLSNGMYLSETKQAIVPKFEEGLSKATKKAVTSRPAGVQAVEGSNGQGSGDGAARTAHLREFDLRVPEMPYSGSAENPTYLNLARSTPQEIDAQKAINKQRKKALTDSNITIGQGADMSGLYKTSLLFSAHREQIVNTNGVKCPMLSRQSKKSTIVHNR